MPLHSNQWLIRLSQCSCGIITHLPRKEMAQTLRMAGCSVPDIAAFVAWDHSTKVDTYLTWPGPRELAVAAGFASEAAYMVPRLLLNLLQMAEFKDMCFSIFPGMDDDIIELHAVRSAIMA